MLSKTLRGILFVLIVISLISFSLFDVSSQAQAAADGLSPSSDTRSMQTGPLYTQPVDPNEKILLSSRLDPDGSDNDQYVWDDFKLQSDGTINEIDWFGVYDPSKFGAGGPVLDFSVSIYASTAADKEPAVANPPLVHYQTGGNAGETSIGTVGGSAMYSYSFSLPTPFMASAGVKYWVQIEASQQGTIPDWCFAAGSGGSGNHYIRTSGAGGDVLYRFAPGDAAFTLLGAIINPSTPTPVVTATLEPPTPPTNTPVDTSTSTPTPGPQVPTCVGAVVALLMFLLLFRLPHR